MSILCLVCVWHSVVPLLVDGDDDDEAVLADRIALGVLSGIYVFFHLFFFLWIYFSVSMSYSIFESHIGSPFHPKVWGHFFLQNMRYYVFGKYTRLCKMTPH